MPSQSSSKRFSRGGTSLHRNSRAKPAAASSSRASYDANALIAMG
jgi:hypothetical protein